VPIVGPLVGGIVGGIFYKLFVGFWLPTAAPEPPGRAPIPDEA
jgi:glycerol uptake facilitator protein